MKKLAQLFIITFVFGFCGLALYSAWTSEMPWGLAAAVSVFVGLMSVTVLCVIQWITEGGSDVDLDTGESDSSL